MQSYFDIDESNFKRDHITVQSTDTLFVLNVKALSFPITSVPWDKIIVQQNIFSDVLRYQVTSFYNNCEYKLLEIKSHFLVDAV